MVARKRQLETIITLALAAVVIVMVALIGRYISDDLLKLFGAIALGLWIIAQAL